MSLSVPTGQPAHGTRNTMFFSTDRTDGPCRLSISPAQPALVVIVDPKKDLHRCGLLLSLAHHAGWRAVHTALQQLALSLFYLCESPRLVGPSHRSICWVAACYEWLIGSAVPGPDDSCVASMLCEHESRPGWLKHLYFLLPWNLEF